MANKKLSEVQIVNTLGDNEYGIVALGDGALGKILKTKLLPLATATTSGLMTSDMYITNTTRYFAPTAEGKIYKIAELPVSTNNNNPPRFGLRIISLSGNGSEVQELYIVPSTNGQMHHCKTLSEGKVKFYRKDNIIYT
ncbi:MAG: hypothetical protein LUG98_01580, partial [Tannerellaceae bacterium]|nr:hypothetical protein [Tannerellaceae bacterium]